jgi:glycine betaine catabolism B
MYRLVLYYLTALLIVAVAFAFFGILSYSPIAIFFSWIVIVAACWGSNEFFARTWKVTPNIESVYITAFILTLIMTPVAVTDFHGALILIIASLIAMASKYILAISKKHVFNPAAIAVMLTGIVFSTYASWWVGNSSLSILVLIGGLLVVRKIQRFDLFFSFILVATAGIVIHFGAQNPLTSLWETLIHSPLIFLGTIMLTEPLTSPPTRLHRVIYGAIVGLFFIPGVQIFSLYSSPEIALVIGNLYAYAASPKSRRVLVLKEKRTIADGIYEFIFSSDKPLNFLPGQYLEWTLGHAKPDTRGNRRYFTIASSPTEKEIHLGIKTYEPSSTFKKALVNMQPGQQLHAGQLAGEFTLPKDTSTKLVFIAGGIGVTPFRSMVQYMIDEKEKRDAVLLYSTKTAEETAYKDTFDNAEQMIGLKTVYGRMFDKDTLIREVPDYKERMFYISGPRSMVVAFEDTLKELNVSRRNIKIDFFPGFA